ncbi:uncharacterized protein LOC106655891 [Trichogramma pretiosum]|uniref:uncharacterized protein LOC106655891 n=1 Tax=Trichogramma pretiosum TaxID=7493 RepID=UPI0006C9C78A|nr:uncharacterized protein LOC106655891 [Trichogramma pretiosum]
MKLFLLIISAVTALTVDGAKEKRGIAVYGQYGLNPYPVNNLPELGSTQFWNQGLLASSTWDSSFSTLLGQAPIPAHNLAHQGHYFNAPPTSASQDVWNAIQQAKEANQFVRLAQQRVDEAKQAAILQQKITLTKESAAQEASRRLQELTAQADADARTSAKQLVAAQQKLAALKDAVAAAQRLAAARESAAAAAIQRNAAITAAEIRKQDVDKQITLTEREAQARNVGASKENLLIPLTIYNGREQKTFPISTSHNPWG